jgi:RHS repeat-associated protein
MLLGSAGAASPVAKVTLAGPASAVAGRTAAFTVTVRPASRKGLAKGTLTLLLSRDAKRDAKDVQVSRKAVKRVKSRKAFKVALTARIPSATAAAAYRMFACLKIGRRTLCASRPVRISRPVPGPSATPAPTPVATGTPAPQPTATPDPTTTPTPDDPPPQVINDPSPAPGPTDAPAADPAAQADALPDESSSSLLDATDFLYTGGSPIQIGVAPGTISLDRAAVLRGRVTNRLETGIGGIRVTVADHPEYGRTATRADGGYDLAVNGGGQLTLVFTHEGYIPAQRNVDVPWQDYVEVDPLALVPYDAKGTRIDTDGANVEAVQATPVDDGSGKRTQTLLFDPGTTATMKVGGSDVPIGDTFTVRSTEFTQGATGEEAMPAQLPATSGYTYAAEFSLDEAAAAGATEVKFSKPVATYLDNFLDLPVGASIPVGYYDRERGEWVGADDGKVIQIVAGGVDTDGDGSADNTGIDAAEQAKLLAMYSAGKQLWRTEITHFSPWDHNFPYGPGPGARGPGGGDNGPPPPPPEDPCDKAGSIILCDSQVLGEELPVAGSTDHLVYESGRVPGHNVGRTWDIRLRTGTLPNTLVAIDLQIEVAGQTIKHSFTAAESEANPVYTFVWDGKDGYGRTVQGTQTVTSTVGYRFKAVILSVASGGSRSWGRVSAGLTLSASRARTEFALSKTTTSTVANLDARGAGLGGWTLSGHHSYDPVARVVRYGEGGSGNAVADQLGALRAITGPFDGPSALTTAPDGAVWVADTRNQRIKRIALDGTVSIAAGTGAYGYRAADDGGPATSARLSSPEGIAVVDAGDTEHVVYIADTGANRIRRIGPDGKITTVAGGGSSLGDGGPATSARLSGPTGVAVAPDGALIIADSNQHRIRMVGTDGTISTMAGTGASGFSGDGGPALAAKVSAPTALIHDAEGRLLFADAGNRRVRRIGADGRIETIAGGGTPADGIGDGEPATAARLLEPTGLALRGDGELVIADPGADRLRLLTAEGTLQTVAGGGSETRADGVAATAVALAAPTGVAVRDDGAIVFSEPSADHVTRIEAPLPGFRDGDQLVGSPDGSQVFQFNRSGRHERTLDAHTGAVLRRFTYDSEGRLASVFDDAAGASPAHSALLTVDRSTPGQIVLRARHNRETTIALDAAGWIDSVTNPAGEKHELHHAANGLLLDEADAEGGTHTFTFDGAGRLATDTNPGLVTQTLARTAIPGGREVTLTTTGGQVETYRTVVDTLGQVVRTTTDAAGATTVMTHRPDGTARIDYPECNAGVCLAEEQRFAPDPRFGLQAPYMAEQRMMLPSGKARDMTATRTATMRDAVRLQTSTETVTTDGKTVTSTFLARPGDDGGTVTTTTAEGVQGTANLDAHGRVTTSTTAGGQAAQTSYDDAQDGRVSAQVQGVREWTYGYDGLGRIQSRTDGEGNAITYTRDLADRILTRTIDGETATFTYDDAGHQLTYESPEGRVATAVMTASGLGKSLTLPGTDAYVRGFTADEQFATETLPSGDQSKSEYDTATGGSRMVARTGTRSGAGAPLTTATFAHIGTTQLLGSASWTRGAATQTVASTYDGDRPTSSTFSGAAAGGFTYAIGATDLRLASTTVTAGAGAPRTYAVARDDDGQVTQHGPFAIARNATTGYAETYAQVADDTTVRNLSTAGFGELDERRVTEAADTLYEMKLTRDDTGRIERRDETVSGVTTVRAYTYDARGRLTRVADGADATVEAYTYDDDGNRLTADSEDHADEPAAYAPATGLQTAAGALSLSFDEDGYLTDRGGDAFTYAPDGELLSAEAGPTTVLYDYDAMGRRTRRTAGADTTSFLYGDPSNALRVTATVDALGELTTYFYDEEDHLHAIERAGARFRVGSDQVGTPRVVVDADGTVVKRVDRDSFGRVLTDSAPAFSLPIGFAGGIEDPHTGLVRFGMRDYDPQTGRWTARDPAMFGGSPENLFAYAENQPTGRRDPTGLWSIGVGSFLGIGGGITISYADGNYGWCSEVGAGAGGGVDIDFAAKPENSSSLVAEGALELGEGSVAIGAEATDCPDSNTEFKAKGYLKGNAGGLLSGQVDTNGDFTVTGGKGVSGKLQAKAVSKDCLSVKKGFFKFW